MLNQLKTVILLGALTGILIWVGSLWGQSGIIMAFGFAVLMNFGAYFFSDKLVLTMYRAREADIGKYPRLYQLVNEVAKKAKLPQPKVYILPTPSSNAFATGRNPKHAVVAVTEGILELLTEKELKGVIAHELAHVKDRDILIASVAATIAGAIGMIAFMARWAALFGGYGGQREGRGMLELLVLAVLTPLLATIIQLAISRSREYLADREGATFIKDSSGLASALKKLEAQAKHNPLRFGSESSAHIFIVNPFRASFLMKLFSTHPDVESRVKRLTALKF